MTRAAPASPDPPAWRTALSTLGLWAFAVPGTIVASLLTVLTAPLGPRSAIFWARVWSRCLLAAGAVRVEVEVDPALIHWKGGTGFVFLANHQSYADIPALYASVPEPLLFAAKQSLFKIPVFGWALSVGGFIPVDRADPSKGKDAFTMAGERLRRGSSVLFFPEGTRSSDGRLGRFHRGGFLLALKHGLPIVPVGISGAYQVMSRHTLAVRPGTIRIRYGAPVDVTEYGVKGRRQLMDDVRRTIAELADLAPEEPSRAAAHEG